MLILTLAPNVSQKLTCANHDFALVLISGTDRTVYGSCTRFGWLLRLSLTSHVMCEIFRYSITDHKGAYAMTSLLDLAAKENQRPPTTEPRTTSNANETALQAGV